MHNLIFRLLIWEISTMLVSTFTCPRGVHNSLLPDPDDCSSYFHCISGGRYYHKSCPLGLSFDNRHKICSWASLVQCKITKTQGRTIPRDKRKETQKGNLHDPFEIQPYRSLSEIEKQRNFKKALIDKRFRKEEVEGSGDIGAETFVDKNVSVMNKRKTQDTVTNRSTVKCVNAFSYLTDPLRCDIFYQCHMWIPYPKFCPKGLYFDDSTFVCNWPHSVNCVNGRRKPLFEQVPILIDKKANIIKAIQNAPIHEKKAIQDKSGNRGHHRVFFSPSRSRTNLESKSVRKVLNRRKTTHNNHFHSTNSFSGPNIPNKHNRFAPVMTTSSLSEGKRHGISTSEKSVSTIIKKTTTPRVFNEKISDTDLMKQRSNIRKKVVEKKAEKDNMMTAPKNELNLSSPIGIDGSVYLQKIFLNQWKGNRTNTISENEIVHKNFKRRENLPNTSHSNRSKTLNESKNFPERPAKIEFTVNEEFLHNNNQSTPNERIILPSSTIVNNPTSKKEKGTQSKIDKEEYHLQYMNGSDFIGYNEKTTVNNGEFSSLIRKFSNSHDITVRTDLNKYNTNINNFENIHSVNKDSLLTISSEIITDRTLTGQILLGSLNTTTTKFYLSGNSNDSKSYTKTVEKLSIVPGFDNYNLFTSEIPTNMSESYDGLMSMKVFNKTKEDKDTIHLERLNQPFGIIRKEYNPTERVNFLEDSKASLFTTTNYSIADLDSNSESFRVHKQMNDSLLPFPNEDILDSKKITRLIKNIPKITKTDQLNTAYQNVSNADHLNKNSENYLTSKDQISNLDLLRSIDISFNETKTENSSSISPLNNNFTINSSRVKKQQKHNENLSNSGENRKLCRDTAEQCKDVLQSNIEREISSLMTTKVFETQDDKYEEYMKEQNSSSDPTIHTTVHSTTVKLNNEKHVECVNVTTSRRDSVSTANVKVVNRTYSDIKTTKTINETNRYTKIDFPTFSLQKTKIKNNESIQELLHRKLDQLLNNFRPGQINTAKLLNRIGDMGNPLAKGRNESESSDGVNDTSFSSSTKRMLGGNLNKPNVTDQTTRPQYLKSKNKSTESTNRQEISFSGIGKPVKKLSERILPSLQNENKTVGKEIFLYAENSSNNSEGFDDPNKMGDDIAINNSLISQGISLEFGELIENSKEIQQGDIISHLNFSADIESTNGSVVQKNLDQNIKRNVNDELFTNITITTNNVALKKNMRSFKGNGSEEAEPKADNTDPQVNTDLSENEISHQTFYDMVSLENKMSTSNNPILNLFQDNKAYNQKYQKMDAEKVEITDGNGIHVNISKNSRGITETLEEIAMEQSQSFASNVSINPSSREKKENKHGVENAPKTDEGLQDSTSDKLNISVNNIEFMQGKSGTISNSYDKTTFSRRSKDTVLLDQKQVAAQQRLHLSLEPEVATMAQEKFQEADHLDPKEITYKKEKLDTGDAKMGKISRM